MKLEILRYNKTYYKIYSDDLSSRTETFSCSLKEVFQNKHWNTFIVTVSKEIDISSNNFIEFNKPEELLDKIPEEFL